MKTTINYFSRVMCAFLLCAGMVMTSCEETNPVDDNKTEQGGNEGGGENNGNGNEGGLNNGGVEDNAPATLTLGKVTATTATFTGHLDVLTSDLSFSQVTVYYSDAETFNINAAESVSTISFDKEQNFTITLTGLKYGTKYNYCMVGYMLGNTVTDNGSVARGVCQADENGFLADIAERLRIEKYEGGIHFTEDGEDWTDLPGETIVSMNMWGFTPSFLQALEDNFPAFLEEQLPTNPQKAEYLLPRTVDQLLKEGKATVKILSSRDRWYGVTYAEDKPVVVAALAELTKQGTYPDGLWK